MVTRDRPEFLAHAVVQFRRQSYRRRELIVIDDGLAGATKIPAGPNIRYFRLPSGLSDAERLDYGLEQARGELFALWDDEAWNDPHRLAYQSAPLLNGNVDISVLNGALSLDLRSWRFLVTGNRVESRTVVLRASVWGAERGQLSFEEVTTRLLADETRRSILGSEGMWIGLVRDGAGLGRCVAEPPLPAADKKFYSRFVRRPRPVPHAKAQTRKPKTGQPLVSCIMPTANRRAFVPHAIQLFQAQDYPCRELVILDDGDDPVGDLIPDDPAIRYFRLSGRRTVGAKRNLACEYAAGDVIVHWDDDDYSAPWRITRQVAHLLRTGADISGLDRVYFAGPGREQAWLYTYPPDDRPWVCGGTFCYLRSLWERNPFPDESVGEDNGFVWSAVQKTVSSIADNTFYIATIHPGNTSPKSTGDSRWASIPVEEVREVAGEAWNELANLLTGRAGMLSSRSSRQIWSGRESAIVSLGAGIGDILRVTPLIRVMDSLGYDVDVVVETDYPDVVSLLEGAPEIRALFHRSSSWAGHGAADLTGLSAREYAIAVHPPWTFPGQFPVAARRVLHIHPEESTNRGVSYAVERLAAEAGWTGALPGPIAMPSQRQFHLPPGTVALHPGCKPDWYWKKWHGFEDLAKLFPSVAIIGMSEDLQNSDTYFGTTFSWPAQARNYVGQLSLKDTAALLTQCRALISNDSGLMHLGAVMGIPVFGIFGITSPAREAMPFPNLFPITKQLPCEPACRLQPARRDCEHNLRCLKTLTAGEVFARVQSLVPGPGATCRTVEYDERYFASGGTGGWGDGYHWHVLGTFYESLAAFLLNHFPGGESFLDVGCGKGFLVRALRRSGRECWGFDPSRCAIQHAVDGVRECVEQVGVDDFRWRRPFDVLLLMDVLDHLSADQAREFLTRARLNTIGCAVAALEPEGTGRDDQHRITRRGRAWWRELFLQAGWKQDFLHRTLEREWQVEARREGIEWELYVYAP